MLAWGFGFWMWRLTLVHGVLCLLSAECSIVLCRVWPETLVTWPWLHLSMIYCCALGLGPQAQGMAAYVRDGYLAFRQPKFECGCCSNKMLVFRVCGVRQNLYVNSLYHNPDLHDWIFDCPHGIILLNSPKNNNRCYLLFEQPASHLFQSTPCTSSLLHSSSQTSAPLPSPLTSTLTIWFLCQNLTFG